LILLGEMTEVCFCGCASFLRDPPICWGITRKNYAGCFQEPKTTVFSA
jgi:hypothetical protein